MQRRTPSAKPTNHINQLFRMGWLVICGLLRRMRQLSEMNFLWFFGIKGSEWSPNSISQREMVGRPTTINSSFLHQPSNQRNNISLFDLLNEKKRLNLICCRPILPFKDKFNLIPFPFHQNKLYLFIPRLKNNKIIRTVMRCNNTSIDDSIYS